MMSKKYRIFCFNIRYLTQYIELLSQKRLIALQLLCLHKKQNFHIVATFLLSV